jgi:hypothetical protein
MATIPMNTMIAEKITLLMVTGSHASDEVLPWGRFGVIAGSFRSAMVSDNERFRKISRVCLSQGCCNVFHGTRLSASGCSCYTKQGFGFLGNHSIEYNKDILIQELEIGIAT